MADSFDQAFADLGLDPSLMGGNTGFTGGATAPATTAPQQGQWAPTNQGFLDWATKNYGANQQGFVNLPSGQNFQNVLQNYTQQTGNQANFLGGPSGDRVDFGQGVQDALTSGGQIWNNATPGGGGATGTGGGGWGGSGSSSRTSGGFTGDQMGSMAMPTPPPVTDLQAPAPFAYQPNQQGSFQSGSPVPTMAQQSYNPMAAPTNFTGSRVGDPAQLNYTSLGTPEGYTAERYEGLTDAQLKSDPSYDWRFKQGQSAAENVLAHSGALRTGNAAQALTNYGQGAASQEYAAADARARGQVAQNNASSLGAAQFNAGTNLAYNQNANSTALQFGQQNIQNQFAQNQANYGRASGENQQNFANQFAVNQANNQGQNAALQANNQNALAAQGQGFNQALAGYGANQGANQQQFQQGLSAYGMNAQTGLGYGSQNQQNQLASYQAQVNAALGLGNLNLGYQQAQNSYDLGQGNLGLGYGQLGLAQSNAQWGQGLDTYDRNYRATVLDPWSQQYQMASLGNPGAPNTQGAANAQSDLYTQQGNAQAAGTVGSANQWTNAASNAGNNALQMAYWNSLQNQPRTGGTTGTTGYPWAGPTDPNAFPANRG